ncbi:MAG: rhodanese-like domain-containing protein [Ignavibacteriaceae bacterium]|nr:rhodanese-like domain-containing protein [Ignavibacteriaceae bacterium]
MNKLKIMPFLVLILLFNFISGTCNAQSMSVKELSKQMKNNKSLVILDVRTDEELVGPLGKIDNVVHIPIDELEKRIHELDQYRKNDIAVICKTGVRSDRGAKILRKYGFKAKNISGGMVAYREKIK